MASSIMSSSASQPEGFIKIDKNIGGKMISLIKILPYDVDKNYLKISFDKSDFTSIILSKYLIQLIHSYGSIFKSIRNTTTFTFKHYEYITMVYEFINNKRDIFYYAHNLIYAVQFYINYDIDNNDKYIKILNYLKIIFKSIDEFIYVGKAINIDKIIEEFTTICNNTKFSEDKYVKYDYNHDNKELYKDIKKICLYPFLYELKNLFYYSKSSPSVDFLQKKKLNFSYEDLLNNFIDEIKYRLYTFEKIKLIKFINNWIIDLDRPSIIKDILSRGDTNCRNWITVKRVMKTIYTSYPLNNNICAKSSLLTEISKMVERNLRGGMITYMSNLYDYNNVINDILVRVIIFKNIYRKWNFNGNLSKLPICDVSVRGDLKTQLALCDEHNEQILTLEHLNELLIVEYLNFRLVVYNSLFIPANKFQSLFLNQLDMDTLEFHSRFRLGISGSKIETLSFNFDHYFRNPENNPFYSIKNHIYPIKKHITTIFCCNNRNNENTHLRFLPSELWFFILKFMRLSDFNIVGMTDVY